MPLCRKSVPVTAIPDSSTGRNLRCFLARVCAYGRICGRFLLLSPFFQYSMERNRNKETSEISSYSNGTVSSPLRSSFLQKYETGNPFPFPKETANREKRNNDLPLKKFPSVDEFHSFRTKHLCGPYGGLLCAPFLFPLYFSHPPIRISMPKMS